MNEADMGDIPDMDDIPDMEDEGAGLEEEDEAVVRVVHPDQYVFSRKVAAGCFEGARTG